MKFRITPTATLSLLVSLAGLAAAQSPLPNIAPPPIKMGLWQSSVTVTGGMGTAGRAITNQSCYTPESWKESMQNMQSRQQKLSCTTSNLQQDSHSLSFDGQCSADQGFTINYHIQMVLDSDSAMHGSSTTKMSGPSFPQGMSMSAAINSKFLSSDCGDIKPGESKSVHP
jgi:Protein of unknown function (DUF3617)